MGNVKVFRSTDYGAPVLYGNAGYLIPVFDACLVNGYGANTINTMTHNAGTVTVTTAVTHNLRTYGRQTISGANESGYNGEFIITVTGANTFTYQAAGITVTPATGTLSTKSGGAGWTKPYNGTNLAAYRGGSGTQMYLRIDDTTTQAARCLGYETMSDVNTGTGPFPTTAQFSGGLYWTKSSTADATNARDWIIVADDKTMYMWVNYNSSATYTDSPMMHFGDIETYKSGDAYHCCLLANTLAATIANFRFSYLVATFIIGDTGMYFPRSYSQAGTAMPGAKISDYSKSSAGANMGGSGLIYPHQTDGALHLAPVWAVETASVLAQSAIRGVFRGLWNPLHNSPLAHLDTFQGSGTLAGKTFLTFRIQPSAQAMLDLSLTW